MCRQNWEEAMLVEPMRTVKQSRVLTQSKKIEKVMRAFQATVHVTYSNNRKRDADSSLFPQIMTK